MLILLQNFSLKCFQWPNFSRNMNSSKDAFYNKYSSYMMKYIRLRWDFHKLSEKRSLISCFSDILQYNGLKSKMPKPE